MTDKNDIVSTPVDSYLPGCGLKLGWKWWLLHYHCWYIPIFGCFIICIIPSSFLLNGTINIVMSYVMSLSQISQKSCDCPILTNQKAPFSEISQILWDIMKFHPKIFPIWKAKLWNSSAKKDIWVLQVLPSFNSYYWSDILTIFVGEGKDVGVVYQSFLLILNYDKIPSVKIF